MYLTSKKKNISPWKFILDNKTATLNKILTLLIHSKAFLQTPEKKT